MRLPSSSIWGLAAHCLASAAALSIALTHASAEAQTSRWLSAGDAIWDTKTVKRINKDTIRVWWRATLVPAQLAQLESQSVASPAEIKRISEARYGVLINCKSQEMGFFNVAWLDSAGNPIIPPVNLPEKEVTMEPLGPETTGEIVAAAACDFAKNIKMSK